VSGRQNPTMNSVRYFCTCFDQNYLPRALALHASLVKHCVSFRLYAICYDEASYATLQHLKLPSVVPISLTDFEDGDSALLQAKQNRSKIEYYFTCTPSLCLYVLAHFPEVDMLTYLDADLYFFSDPEPLFAEMDGYSIGMIGHRFATGARRFERYGLYNVGWLSFCRDVQGMACLSWWRERCLEWCYDRLQGDRFADQKYLDEWPERFKKVRVIQHKGANVAGWNIANYLIREESGRVWIDEQPLIFFHFANFKEIKPWLFKTGFGSYMVRPSHVVRRHIFWPYIYELNCVAPKQNLTGRIRKLDFHLGSFKQWIRNTGRFIRGVLFQEYIFYCSGKRSFYN